MNETDNKIIFKFFPYNYDTIDNKNEYLVEKADKEGRKRRYITGVASGMQMDAHNERLTKNAIQSMMRQANSGDILLYPDVHNIKDNEDIGILENAEILPNGDWKTYFRLYDEFDNLGQDIVEKNEKLWRKMNGLPPYTNRRQKGFSIEGYVPPKSIISMNKDGGQRVIDDVILEGVILVPKPAYNSIAEAVYKCLGEVPPKIEEKIRNNLNTSLNKALEQRESEVSFYKNKYDLENAMDGEITNIMRSKSGNKKGRLEILFDEYKSLMVPLLMKSSTVFNDEVTASEDNKGLESDKMKELLFKANQSVQKVQEALLIIKKEGKK